MSLGEGVAAAGSTRAYFAEDGSTEAGRVTGSKGMVRVALYPGSPRGLVSMMRRALHRTQFVAIRDLLLVVGVGSTLTGWLAMEVAGGTSRLGAGLSVALGALGILTLLFVAAGHLVGTSCARRDDSLVVHMSPSTLRSVLAGAGSEAQVRERLESHAHGDAG